MGILDAPAASRAALINRTGYTPEDYGAKGDGTTDDSAAIAAAYAAAAATGGHVVLRPTTYRVASTILLNVAKTVELLGFGATLKPDAGVYALDFNDGRSSTDITTVVRGLTVNGAGVGNGVKIVNDHAATMRDVRVINCATGVLITGDSGGWAESSNLDGVVIDGCMVGIDFQQGTGTGSHGYLHWGFVGIYGIPTGGIGVRVGNGVDIYHANFGMVITQLAAASVGAIGWQIAGAIGRNTYIHMEIEASVGATGAIGIDLQSTAVLDQAAIYTYFQGTFALGGKIHNPNTIAYQVFDGAGKSARGHALGTGNNLYEGAVFGDSFARIEIRADRWRFGPGNQATDCGLVRWGGDLLGMDTGDSWKVDGTWNGGHLVLGTNHLWTDATGSVRIKNGAPTSDLDGSSVGPAGVAITSGVTAARANGNWQPADHGLLAWTYDPIVVAASFQPTAGAPFYAKLWVPTTITIANILVSIQTAGTGATALANCFVAVLDSTGARLGVSADQSSAWATTGPKVAAVTLDNGKSLTIAGSQSAYVWIAGIVGTQSTTPVKLHSGALGSGLLTNANIANGAGLRAGTTGTGLTAIPTSIVPANLTSSAASIFAGVS